MNVIDRKQSQVFFVDGLRRTGKTFLYRALMSTLRNRGKIVLATMSSSIAATLLLGGRTAHFRFNLPFDLPPNSICNIKKQKDLAKLIRVAVAIIWDEDPMTNIYCLKALDRTLKDILDCDAPFGGKVMIMGEDFRQVLPVIQKGSKTQMICTRIIMHYLWANAKVLHLVQNMRSMNNPEFAQFLMRIGDDVESTNPMIW